MTPEKKPEEVTFVAISGLNVPTRSRQYLMNLVRDVVEREGAKFVAVLGNIVDGRAIEVEFKKQRAYEIKQAVLRHRGKINEAKANAKAVREQFKQKLATATKTYKDAVAKADKTLEDAKAELEKKHPNDTKAYRSAVAEEARKIEASKVEALAKLNESNHEFTEKVGAAEAEIPLPFDREVFKQEFEEDFTRSLAIRLNEFFPKIKDVNYHVAIAQRVFDRDIGVRILEQLQSVRDDIRLLGEKKDGSYDPEPRIPVRMKGFQEVRALLPRRAPWFYRIITGFMQRLIGSHAHHTFSDNPDMYLVGCTGTAAYLPYYEGVPCISVPTLHKIDEQLSTENMVGCTIVKVISEDDRKRIIWRTEDFRTAIINEKEFAIPEKASKEEKAVLRALLPSDASMKTILFRLNTVKRNGHIYEEAEVLEILSKLRKKSLVLYNEHANRYGIDERLVHDANVTLAKTYKNARKFKQVVISCVHVGALKTLYHTVMEYLPAHCVDADVLVENGDAIQGISHNYEYNGDMLPIFNGVDKHEIGAAHMRAKTLLDIFRLRLKTLPKSEKGTKFADVLRHCIIDYALEKGNHPAWIHWGKHALILHLFVQELTRALIDGVYQICVEQKVSDVDYETIKTVVAEKIHRVGESRMVSIKGVVIGIKHPFKGRTLNKSHRIQDVVDFVWNSFAAFAPRVAKKAKGFGVVDVANFHEAAAVHVVKFGRTVIGLMTGTMLRDTSFEANIDKVVDYGPAIMEAGLDENDRLIYSQVEYDNRIHPEDAKLVLANELSTSLILKLCDYITSIVDIPWRE